MTSSKSNIFCPNCSANNKIEQNFCRFCGLNLKETAKSLVAQLTSDKNARRLKKLGVIKKLSDFASIGLVIIVSAGILVYLYIILTKMVFSGERVFFGLVLIFMTLQFVTSYIRRKNTVGYWEEVTKENSLKQNELEKFETAKLLEEKPFEPVASVTENSTKLLFVENKTKKLG